MGSPVNLVTAYLEVHGILSCANIKACNSQVHPLAVSVVSVPQRVRHVPVPTHFHSAPLFSQLGDQALPPCLQTPLMAMIKIISSIYKILITSSSEAFRKQFPLFNEPCYRDESIPFVLQISRFPCNLILQSSWYP